MKCKKYLLELEHYIFLELKAYQIMHDIREGVNYYRDSQGHEVDFIMGNQAFEVKIKSNVVARDIKGLLIFGEDYGAKLNVICTCDIKRLQMFGKHQVSIWPVEEFLKSLWNGEIEL